MSNFRRISVRMWKVLRHYKRRNSLPHFATKQGSIDEFLQCCWWCCLKRFLNLHLELRCFDWLMNCQLVVVRWKNCWVSAALNKLLWHGHFLDRHIQNLAAKVVAMDKPLSWWKRKRCLSGFAWSVSNIWMAILKGADFHGKRDFLRSEKEYALQVFIWRNSKWGPFSAKFGLRVCGVEAPNQNITWGKIGRSGLLG